MIKIEQELRQKKQELENLIERIERKQGSAPQGSLRVSRDGDGWSFYHYLREQRTQYPLGKYIPRNEEALIHDLAQKEYDAKVLRWAKDCCAKLEKLLKIYQDGMCSELYEKLGEGKRELVSPYELPAELFARQWLSRTYTGKEMYADSSCFITEKGERVRSKSEKILADNFYRKGIPYKYECPLLLKGYGTVYPDFTLLNKRTGEVRYWEHLGMMDNSEYLQKAIIKIHTYEQNGIFQGKQLVLSYETKDYFNMDAVNILIQEFLE